MQAATRMADGQWPWRDFGWAYGPGEPLVVMPPARLFGPSLLWWRLLRVAADATAAVLVWALVRGAAGRAGRWPRWAAAAVTAAQPTSANPTGPALAFALAAVLLATRGRPGWAGAAGRRWPAFWRPDVGAIAALAAAATLLPGGGREGDDARLRGAAPARPRGARRARRAGRSRRGARRRGPRVALLAVRVAAGPGRVWDALVVQATRDGAWWRLPFPPGFHGPVAAHVKDFLRVAGAVRGAASCVVARRAGASGARAGLLVLGARRGGLLRLAGRLEHAQALLVRRARRSRRSSGRSSSARRVLGLADRSSGAANRASALLRPPDLRAVLDGGVRVPPAEAAALPRRRRARPAARPARASRSTSRRAARTS